jgi:hypothetical protein
MWTYSSDITFPVMGLLLCLDRRDKIIVLHSGFISSREYFKRTDKPTGLSSYRFEIMSRLIHLAPNLKYLLFSNKPLEFAGKVLFLFVYFNQGKYSKIYGPFPTLHLF